MAKRLPAVAELWDQLSYNPLTGEMFWLHPKKGRQLNRPVGTNDNGYRKVVILRQPCLLHRVIWAWITGSDPGDLCVDHIDRDRGNNRWGNLRVGTAELNGVNRPGKGYYRRDRANPWFVTRYTALGHPACESYATEEEAKARADELFTTRVSLLNLPRSNAVKALSKI